MAIIRRHKSTIYGLQADLTNLTTADTTESARAQQAEATLQTNIDNEATARLTADTGLQTQIDSLGTIATDLQTQITANDGDITTINGNIGTLSGLSTTDKSSIVNSINELHTVQQTKLEAEDVPPIVIAYTGVLTNLTTDNQNSLVEAINEVDAHADTNAAGLAAEITNRTSADTTLQGNIDAEASARIAADNTLTASVSANTTAINNEVTARTNADTTLQGNIDTEATTRANADTALQGNIDAEEAARISGDATTLTDAKAYTDSSISASATTASNTYLAKSSNLGDLTDVAAARTNLEVMSASEVAAAIHTAELAMGTNYDVADITSRDALTDLDLADRVFVQDDGDGKWALYKVSAIDGGSVTAWTKIGDQDALENSLTADGIKAAYESNADTNAFTDAEKAQIVTNTNDIATLDAAVISNDADIAQHASDIAANATAISDEATARTNADTTLQGNIDTVSGNLTTEISNRTSADAAIQAELDATQTGVGLGTDGVYTANSGSNYLTGATSLVDADNKLDAQIKVNADAIASLSGAVGGATGDLSSLTTDAKSTLVAAINEVDAHADANATAISNEITARQTADATLQTNIGTVTTNLSNEVTARTNADATLQANIDAEESARIAGDALKLDKSANLSDVANVATARTNLGVYSTSEVDTAITAATANLVQVASESVVVSNDLITLTNAPVNGVILNFNTVRYVDENGNSFDIPVAVTATAGGKEFALSPDASGQFDTKSVFVQYMY